jgi:4-diphosphocytidyl-2-C-methyl-D-erythritol kinase
VIKKKSPAKINLYLRVLQKRADGYHDIISLMQLITLYDELIFSPHAGGVTLDCPQSDLPADENNLVYRAAAAFYSRTGILPGIKITLHKHIPVGAGLGGGSSNAATTLAALNEIHKMPLTKNELMQLGATLGADVPFFLFGKTAWASGRGEMLQEAPPLPPLWFVVINPGFPVSTKEIYQGLNWGLTKKRINYSILRFSSVKEIAAGLTNDLEGVTSALYPVLNEIKAFLMENGALGALMTGSGPTVFGIFASEEAAARVERVSASQKGLLVFGARPFLD